MAFIFALVSFYLAAGVSAVPTATLSGTTQDDQGNRMAGVRVSFGPSPYFWTYLRTNVSSDSNGQFSVNLPQGPWTVRGSVFFNYQPSPTHMVVLQTNTSVVLSLRSNSPNCFIRGRVVQEDGLPLPFYAVEANLPIGFDHRTTFTDVSGTFQIPAYGGFWSLTASPPPGYMFPVPEVNVTDGLDATNVTLIRRAAATSVSGAIHCADGNPFPYLELTAKAEIDGTPYAASATSDSEGNFHFDLPKGTWTVVPYYWSDAVLSCALDLPHTFSLTNDFSLSIGGRTNAVLEVRAVDDGGNPVPGVTVNVPSIFYFSQTTDSNGYLSISVVPGFQWVDSQSPAGFLSPLSTQPFLAVAGHTNKLQLLVRRITAHITGSAVTDGGLPISGALIEADSGQNGEYVVSTETDVAGHFDLLVANGSWKVTPQMNQSCYWLCYKGAAPQIVQIQDSDQFITFQAEALTSLAHIRGRVLDHQGQPLTNALIQGWNSADSPSFLIRASDSQGNFDFEVFDGVWNLGPWQTVPPSDILPQVSATIANQTDHDGVILRGLARERYLTCAVRTENGEPVPNMTIQADRSVDELHYNHSAYIGILGSTSLYLPSGQWRIQVSDYGLNPAGYQSIPAQVVDLAPGTNEIAFIAHPIVGDPLVPHLRSVPLPNHAIEVIVSSQTLNSYCIQVSADLQHWTPFLTNYTLNGSFKFTDSTTNTTQRFYRAFLLP
jgi:hypothetical protein